MAIITQQKGQIKKIDSHNASLRTTSIQKSGNKSLSGEIINALKSLDRERSRKALKKDSEMPIGYQASPEHWQRIHGKESQKRETKTRVHAPRVTGEVVKVGRFSYAEHGNNVRIFLDEKNIVSYNKTSLDQTQKALQFLQWNYGADAPIKILGKISNDLQPLIPPEPGSVRNRTNTDQRRVTYIRRTDPRPSVPRTHREVVRDNKPKSKFEDFRESFTRGCHIIVNELKNAGKFFLDSILFLGEKVRDVLRLFENKLKNTSRNPRNNTRVDRNPRNNPRVDNNPGNDSRVNNNPNENHNRNKIDPPRVEIRDRKDNSGQERRDADRPIENRSRRKSSMLDSQIATLSYTEFEHNGEYNGIADIFRSKKELKKGYVFGRETLKADAVNLLKKAIANNEVPVFYQASHGNKNTNNMTGYDSVWLDAIADAIKETGYNQPVIIENCHCYSGVRLLELNVLKRFPKGTILLKNQDDRKARYYEAKPQVPSSSKNATLIDSLAYFSGEAIPDTCNNMTCAIVDNHGNPRLYSEDGSYAITTDLGVIKSERLPQKFSEELSNKIRERGIPLYSSNTVFALRCLEMSRMFQGLV